ncbi:unnamed protein product [Rhodiola kirilowii]
MATVVHSESKRMYSWWWNSHISPKNSKWLLENLAVIIIASSSSSVGFCIFDCSG